MRFRTITGLLSSWLILMSNAWAAKDYLAESQIIAQSIRTAGLCGEYIADAESSLLDKLTFKARNIVEIEVSGLVDELVYLIRDEQLTIRADKVFFSLQIGDNELLGRDHWTKDVVFVKGTGQPETCGDYEIDAAYLADLAAALCHADGIALQDNKQLKQAAEQYQACCDIKSAVSCNQYGVLQKLMRDNKSASAYFRRACDLGYGGGCSNLAQMQTQSGHHYRAAELNKEACDKGFKTSCIKTAFEDYALFIKESRKLDRAGNYDRAIVVAKKAIEVAEKNTGRNHPDVATSLNNLALLYRNQGRHAQAEPLYKRALAIREKALGPDHPDVAASLYGLALLYDVQEQYAQAEPLYKRALEIDKKVLGPDHPAVAFGLQMLGFLYLVQEQYTLAEPFFKRVLAIREKTLGPDHPDVVTSIEELAVLYRAAGRDQEAEILEQRADRIRATQK